MVLYFCTCVIFILMLLEDTRRYKIQDTRRYKKMQEDTIEVKVEVAAVVVVVNVAKVVALAETCTYCLWSIDLPLYAFADSSDLKLKSISEICSYDIVHAQSVFWFSSNFPSMF